MELIVDLGYAKSFGHSGKWDDFIIPTEEELESGNIYLSIEHVYNLLKLIPKGSKYNRMTGTIEENSAYVLPE